MSRSRGLAEFEAALVLVMVAISLSSVVYASMRGFRPQREVVFVNSVSAIPGTVSLTLLEVNASAETGLVAVEADSASSAQGVLTFDGASYGTSKTLCQAGLTSFFSVFAPTSGAIKVASDGMSWVDGRWSSSYPVAEGWHEVMISGASSCTVTLPSGQMAAYPGAYVSSVPLIGPRSSTNFTLFLPSDSSPHSLLLAFDGGLDRIAA